MKQKCNTCKIEKNLSEYHKDKNRKLGVGRRCKSCSKEYRKLNKVKYDLLATKNRAKNKEKYKEYSKNYYRNNKEYFSTYNKNYRQSNQEKLKKYREKRKSLTNKQFKERRESDPLFKLKGTLRNRIYTMFKFKDWEKNKHTEEILGAPYEDVKEHIENTFQKGMTWENHGEWHIDHKIPLDSAQTEEDLYKLCHYTNLQALWAFDNISKGAII